MKKILFLTMVLALSTSVASAAVTGFWIPELIGGGLSRYTLQVSSDEGVMSGFDMAVMDPSASLVQAPGVIFDPLANNDTHFLFQASHYDGGVVNDLAIGAQFEDPSVLVGAFTATAGNLYDGGFTNPVNVCQIVMANPELINACEFLEVGSTGGLPQALARIGIGVDAYLTPITIVPEPASVLIWSLLGLVGVVAWRRRR